MKNIKIVLLFLCGLSGCYHQTPEKMTPNVYYLDPYKSSDSIGRVAVVELTNTSAVHSVSLDLTEVLFQEIQKQQVFGLTMVRCNDEHWKRLQLEPDSTYTLEDLAQIRDLLKCDALLTGTVTDFKPYPHLSVGLRLRLIDLSDGRLIWAMEQFWDATDKNTADRIVAFYSPKKLFWKEDDLKGQLGTVSSLKFFKFVAHETAKTLVISP